MIRQAHTYLVGAMSGATLIAIAIAVFVVLVSTQVFTDWPIGALGGGGRDVAVHAAEPVGGASAGGAASAAGATGGGGSAAAGGSGKQPGGHQVDGGSTPAPGGPAGTGTTSPGGSGGSGGGSGAANGGGSAGSGGSSGQSSESAGSSSGGGKGGTGGGESGGGESGGGESTSGGSGSSPAATITEAVNETVSGVDEKVLGGALEETGVTEVTEGIVNGVGGPESAVGHALDETVHAVGGLLGGGR